MNDGKVVAIALWLYPIAQPISWMAGQDLTWGSFGIWILTLLVAIVMHIITYAPALKK